jgi:hypothetical protein
MHTIRRYARPMILIMLVAALASSLAFARELSFDDRVAAQKAIERV